MSEKWTPGPWTAAFYGVWMVLGYDNWPLVANMNGVDDAGEGTDKANARLISAAPDFAEAATVAECAMNDAIDDCCCRGEIELHDKLVDGRNALLAALAKARGEGK